MDMYAVGGTKKITINYLVPCIKNSNDRDEHFKRRFMLLVIGVFLAPSTRTDIPISYLNVVEDVNYIRTYSWEKFILDFFISNISKV